MEVLARHKRSDDPSKKRLKAIRKFKYYFPRGFDDRKYIAWERDYKWNAHLQWKEKLNRNEFSKLLDQHKYEEIAKRVVTIESKTNLLFSFEKMAFRDAVKTPASSRTLHWDYLIISMEREISRTGLLRFGTCWHLCL